MFGTLGGPEIFLILVIALIVFGPRKLPEIGKSMGRMLAEFRRASNDFKRTIEEEVEAENARKSEANRISTTAAALEPSSDADQAPSVTEPASPTVSRDDPPPPIEPK